MGLGSREQWALGVMGMMKKWMGVMDLGSNEPWEYWTFVTEMYLGVMNLGSNGPWEY